MRKEDVCVPAELIDASYIYRGGLDEHAVGVDVVIEDDDADHDPHTEEEGVLAAEATRILPKEQQQRKTDATEPGFHTVHPREAKVWVCVCVCEDSRRLQHDSTHIGHGAETVCGFLQWKTFILQRAT